MRLRISGNNFNGAMRNLKCPFLILATLTKQNAFVHSKHVKTAAVENK